MTAVSGVYETLKEILQIEIRWKIGFIKANGAWCTRSERIANHMMMMMMTMMMTMI
jgi:hypothetical protein